MLDDAAHGAQPGALSVGFGPVNSPPRLARTRQLLMTTSQAAAAASGPERTIRTRMACPRCSRASALHSPRRRRSVAPQTRSPVARSSRHCMPSQKHPQCFDHRRGWARGWAAWATVIAARPFNPVDQTGHQAACRWSHRALLMPIAQKSWAPAPSSAAAVMPESSLSAPSRLLKTVLKRGDR